MTCPRCAMDVADGAADCPSCGVIFSKLRARSDAPAGDARGAAQSLGPGVVRRPPFAVPVAPAEAMQETLGVPNPGWRHAVVGLALAGALTFFPFVNFILSPLGTLVHEIGHTTMFWAFGYPAIPAFDFGEGGGVTMGESERAPVIILAWALGLAALMRSQWENKQAVAALGLLAVVYFFAYGGLGEELAICLGGHGGEILFAAVFLYRALTGWGCIHQLERPLYAFLAFKILFSNIGLGMNLMSPTLEREIYLEGKRGIDNDLTTAAQLLGWQLEKGVARGLVAAAGAAVPAAFAAAALRRRIGAISDEEELLEVRRPD